MTVQEFWTLCQRPENRSRIIELLRGEVIELPIPYHKHGVVCARMGFLLDEYAHRVGLGYILLGCVGTILPHPPPSVLGPDVAYHTHATADGESDTGWVETIPVLVVEVVSANDDPAVTDAKIREYLTNGVEVVWQVDCEERNVTVYRPDKPMEVIKQDGDLTGGDALPGLSIKVADLFRLPGDRPPAPPATPPQPPAAP